MIFFLALAIAMAFALLGGFLYFDLSRRVAEIEQAEIADHDPCERQHTEAVCAKALDQPRDGDKRHQQRNPQPEQIEGAVTGDPNSHYGRRRPVRRRHLTALSRS